MTLTSISPETDVTSFSKCRVYVPLSGRTLGVMISSVYVGFVTIETRSPGVSSLSPKIHLGLGVGYPVMGTRIVSALGTKTSRPFLNPLKSIVGPTKETKIQDIHF